MQKPRKSRTVKRFCHTYSTLNPTLGSWKPCAIWPNLRAGPKQEAGRHGTMEKAQGIQCTLQHKQQAPSLLPMKRKSWRKWVSTRNCKGSWYIDQRETPRPLPLGYHPLFLFLHYVSCAQFLNEISGQQISVALASGHLLCSLQPLIGWYSFLSILMASSILQISLRNHVYSWLLLCVCLGCPSSRTCGYENSL